MLGQRRHQTGATLSGGEQQMLAIGRALMAAPRLLMLDEPSLGLAPLVVQAIFQVIRELHRRGVTILLVEQNVRQALAVADRGYVLATGRVILEGSGDGAALQPRRGAGLPQRGAGGRQVSGLELLLQQLINAVSIGSLYALMAIGLAMVFGILRLINFAHGDLIMVGSYAALLVLVLGLPFPVAAAAGIAASTLAGLVMERVAYRPLRGAHEMAMLLTSFSVTIFLENLAIILFRPTSRPFPAPAVLRSVIDHGAAARRGPGPDRHRRDRGAAAGADAVRDGARTSASPCGLPPRTCWPRA